MRSRRTDAPSRVPRALGAECSDYDLTTFATVERTGEGETLLMTATNSVSSTASFGFLVPGALPATDGKTDEEIGEELKGAAGLQIRVEEPAVDFEVDESGAGKGTLTGYVQLGALDAYAAAGTDIASFATDGRVKTILSFSLAPAYVRSAVDLDMLQVAPLSAAAQKPGLGSVASALTTNVPNLCEGCLAVGTQTICTGSTAKSEPLPAFLIDGESGPLKLITTDAGLSPTLDRTGASAVGVILGPEYKPGTTTPGWSVPKIESTFYRWWRAGAAFQAFPPCATKILNAKPAPAGSAFPASDGWIPLSWAPFGAKPKGCDRKILVCQQFIKDTSTASVQKLCGPNTTLDANGRCSCASGYARAFDACVPAAGSGCSPNAELAKDDKGNTTCFCAPGWVGDGKTCVADPCGVASACGAGQACAVTADYKPHCFEALAQPAGVVGTHWAAMRPIYDALPLDKSVASAGYPIDLASGFADDAGVGSGSPADVARAGTLAARQRLPITVVTELTFLMPGSVTSPPITVPVTVGTTAVDTVGKVVAGSIEPGRFMISIFLTSDNGTALAKRWQLGILGGWFRIGFTRYAWDPVKQQRFPSLRWTSPAGEAGKTLYVR